FNKVLKKVFGSKNERDLKQMTPIVESINRHEEAMQALDSDALKALAGKFKERVASGESLDELLPEAFAAVREASMRTLKMRHFDSQLIGGYVLHQGKIAEMKTGEGKTLAATLPLYLNALSGKGAHLVTVNDYLARRDAVWMGPLFHNLGLTVGIIQHEASFLFDPSVTGDTDLYNLQVVGRDEAYAADVTYATNNELGFDYLRDNMKFSIDEYVQKHLNFAIVDEVDSILIDEARTPLIISGPTESSTDKYYSIDAIIPGLEAETHYTVDEKGKQIFLTDEGVSKVEKVLDITNLYDPKEIETLHHVNQGLKAHVLFKKDVDYVVKDGEVIIVDEFTGRLMSGRRWSDGLHQAVEAKERVTIESENQTLATVTFQNFFRMYEKLAGMTGTADTEAGEFYDIYRLEVIVVPTNKPMIRDDKADLVYKTEKEKFRAVVKDIKENRESGRPTLVGTISIDDSERLSKMLKRDGVKHEVLNAKQHDREAEIVAQAGSLGAVTISTNMAGRGTDIVLGGNPVFRAEDKAGRDHETEAFKAAFEEFTSQCAKEKEKVLGLGGLYIVGTERHESRRIDNQLRGRSGRQGDPGESRFYISLDDDLMRIFGSERIASIMSKLGMEEDVPIEHGMVSKAIEGAQKKVEGNNFDIRKHLLEYDDVMNQQREVVYDYRRQILSEDSINELVLDFSYEVLEELVDTHIDEKLSVEERDTNIFFEAILQKYDIVLKDEDIAGIKKNEEIVERLSSKVADAYKAKLTLVGEEIFLQFEKIMMLTTLDNLWKDHLLSMDHLKSGIGLRGYGQKDPLNEYKKEGYDLFADMIFTLKSEVIERIYRVQIQSEPDDDLDLEYRPPQMPEPTEQKVTLGRGPEVGAAKSEEPEKMKPQTRAGEKVGRNDPCPCGSGKKYKRCCGV
ncbi:MAG: preprotein translocase subunit SecA, partial [Proteobacteria bacterium]|nr:preprotein translocase subunit SecA [Pseudomonadota bacterium]